MTPSDIVAIVAIIVSAIVSVVSAIITYKNNKANIGARRSEIAFEKRLDAFREYVENIGKLRFFISNNTNLDNEVEHQNFFNELHEKYDELSICYQKLRVYFPGHIDDAILEHKRMIAEYGTSEDYKNIGEFEKELRVKEKEIVTKIQSYIGFNN